MNNNLRCVAPHLCEGPEPELSILPNLSGAQQLRLEPVVDAGVIQLWHPGAVMEVAEDLGVLLGDLFPARDQEASAAWVVLLQGPAIGAVVGVLGQGVGEQQREGDQGEPHCVSGQSLSAGGRGAATL